jgi:hypothetical protein
MKFLSQLLAALCLSSALQRIDAKGSKKSKGRDDDDDLSDLTSLTIPQLLESEACGRVSGCVIATGKQVVEVSERSRSAFGQFDYSFDAGFTEMTYVTRVYNPDSAATSFVVDEMALVCALAGTPAATADDVDAITLVYLDGFSPQGVLREAAIGNEDIEFDGADAKECAGVTINNLAALYAAMLRGEVAFLATVAETISPSNTQFIRGQVITPQKSFKDPSYKSSS